MLIISSHFSRITRSVCVSLTFSRILLLLRGDKIKYDLLITYIFSLSSCRCYRLRQQQPLLPLSIEFNFFLCFVLSNVIFFFGYSIIACNRWFDCGVVENLHFSMIFDTLQVKLEHMNKGREENRDASTSLITIAKTTAEYTLIMVQSMLMLLLLLPLPLARQKHRRTVSDCI